jgi:hypothetical protein
MTDAKSAGDQCDALITLSVAYQGARDITQEVLRIAFGNHFLATARPVWPQPFLSVQQKREKTKALDRFLNQSKDVIRKVLIETNDAIDGLVASGTDVSPTWLVADPLNGFLGALPITEIVQVAVEQDVEFESAIQSISKKLVVLNRKANSATQTDKPPTIGRIVLKSIEIRDRYNLSSKQIRDWAKDERKPFITRIAGQRKYGIDPNHPELVALKK